MSYVCVEPRTTWRWSSKWQRKACSVSAVALFRLARWAEMATRLPVRPAIIVVMTMAIMVAIVFSMISGGNGCSGCRTDGTAENSTISATYLVADGSPNCSANTAA